MSSGAPDYWLRGARIQLINEVETVDLIKEISHISAIDTVTTIETVNKINSISTVNLIETINLIKRIQAVGPNSDIYGDGSDGDKTVTADWTLDRDYNFRNLTVNEGVTLNTANYKIRCTGKFVNKGTVTAKGLGASGGTSGVTPSRKFSPDGTVILGGGGGGGGKGQLTADSTVVSGSGGKGGDGGGLIWIAAAELYNNGVLNASGLDGAVGTGAGNVAGAYALAAQGGSGGGGGGGLIMLIYKYHFANLTAVAPGGAGAAAATYTYTAVVPGGSVTFVDGTEDGAKGGDGYVSGGSGGVKAFGATPQTAGDGSAGGDAAANAVSSAGGGGGGGGAAAYSPAGAPGSIQSASATGGAGGSGGAGVVYVKVED